MALAIVYSRACSGICAPLVTVEVHLSPGLPGMNIVGLPEKAVKESKDRVRSAIFHSKFAYPARRITVNLAPADLPKEGGRFDLPIALGILLAEEQLQFNAISEYEFIGELALSGELRPVRGVLPFVLAAHRAGRKVIVPTGNAQEAALVEGACVYHASHLLEVCAFLRGEQNLPTCELSSAINSKALPDLADVCGQPHAKRALEVAAAGRHALLMVGPPGTGKTMLASRLPGIMPELSHDESLDSALVASISYSGFKAESWGQVAFRAPHHSSSSAALVGGGRPPKPGEISLAHHGVLFLDELPEFNRQVLESLREPLESGEIVVSRAAVQTVFPASFQLIAAMNPCPCGYSDCEDKPCECTLEQIKRYRAKVSGPLLDRIDMHIAVPRVPARLLALADQASAETSEIVKGRVMQARQIQVERQGKVNAQLSVAELRQLAGLGGEAREVLDQAQSRLRLSARAYHRVIKLARTLADLGGQSTINQQHIAEALGFRLVGG